jgi:uracil phosphoribosyltransferase
MSASNVHISTNAEFHSQLTTLRDRSLPSREVRSLVASLSSLICAEALASPYSSPRLALAVILRSGLAMSDPFLSLLPAAQDVVVYHLGLFREKETLEPVEYYNKLPLKDQKIKHAFIVDPILATGGTAGAAINILRYDLFLKVFLLHSFSPFVAYLFLFLWFYFLYFVLFWFLSSRAFVISSILINVQGMGS